MTLKRSWTDLEWLVTSPQWAKIQEISSRSWNEEKSVEKNFSQTKFNHFYQKSLTLSSLRLVFFLLYTCGGENAQEQAVRLETLILVNSFAVPLSHPHPLKRVKICIFPRDCGILIFAWKSGSRRNLEKKGGIFFLRETFPPALQFYPFSSTF